MAVVSTEITSEAEELCSKPQEEPRTLTSEPEHPLSNALTANQV